jgi:hypothetical protein
MAANALDLIAALLFSFLALGAANKVFRRYQADFGIFPPRGRSIPIYAIFSALFVYAMCRAVVTLLVGVEVIPNDEDLDETLWQCVPACAFCILQTTMIWKWMRHVGEASELLRLKRTSWGDVVILASSGAVLFFVAIAVSAAISSGTRSSAIDLSRSDWKTLINVYTGGMYVFNGLCFLTLGLRLYGMWSSPAEADKPARFRMLLMAAFFGMMCVLRGLILLLFLFAHNGRDAETSSGSGEPKKHLTKVLSSSWAAPAVLIGEWICIVIALFFLPVAQESAVSSAELLAQSRPSQLAITPRTPRLSRPLNSSEVSSSLQSIS